MLGFTLFLIKLFSISTISWKSQGLAGKVYPMHMFTPPAPTQADSSAFIYWMLMKRNPELNTRPMTNHVAFSWIDQSQASRHVWAFLWSGNLSHCGYSFQWKEGEQRSDSQWPRKIHYLELSFLYEFLGFSFSLTRRLFSVCLRCAPPRPVSITCWNLTDLHEYWMRLGFSVDPAHVRQEQKAWISWIWGTTGSQFSQQAYLPNNWMRSSFTSSHIPLTLTT